MLSQIRRCWDLLGDDGDGNSLSDGLNVIAVDRVSRTFLLQPSAEEHRNTSHHMDEAAVYLFQKSKDIKRKKMISGVD